MKFAFLVLSGLWRSPTRTLLTFLSAAATFSLFGTLYAINTGFESAIDKFSANRLRVVSDTPAAMLPIAFVSQIRALPHVSSIMTLTPLGCYYQDHKNLVFALALGGDVNLDVLGDLNLPMDQAQALFKRRTGAIVGRDLAEKHGWVLGLRIPLTGFAPKKDGTTLWEFDIVGIYDVPNRADSAELFLFNYEYLEESRVSQHGSAAFIFVDTTDADHNTSVAAAIDSSFANSVQPTFTQSEREFQLEVINRAVDMQLIVNVIVMSSLFTLLLVVGNTMSRAVRERVCEFSVLRALGYSTARISALVIAEVQVLSLSAALLGLVTANAIFPAVAKLVNLVEIVMPLSVAAQAFGIAFVVALLSSLPSVLQIRRPSIVEGLAGR